MCKFDFKSKSAFTLAEVIITLGIIGIVAVITIPTLINNINQNVFSEAQDLAIKKIRASTDLMRNDDLLSGFATNDAFADAFQKYIKVAKRCDSSSLQNCFVTDFTNPSGQVIHTSDLSTGTDIGQAGNNSSLVGIDLLNGATMILAFNPNCQRIDPYNNKTDTTSCMAIVYDVNGFGKPNQIGKDIGLLNAAITACDGVKVSGLCVAPTDTTYEPDCVFPYDDCTDYWDGARMACSALGMRLPTKAELSTMYANKSKLSGMSGIYWSSEEWAGDQLQMAYFEDFSSGTQAWTNKGDNYSARCVK